MRLFEYAIYHDAPGREMCGPYMKAEIICGPKAVLASSEAEVFVMASKEVPKDLEHDLGHVKIVVRPFGPQRYELPRGSGLTTVEADLNANAIDDAANAPPVA